MKILILGAGKMGTFLTDCLCTKHEVALYDTNINRLRFVFNTQRFTQLDEISTFAPDLCINAVTLKYTIDAFDSVLPYLPERCILSDIASVKTGLRAYYAQSGHRYVSTHPMFGPTFANLDNLSTQNAIIVAESDPDGKAFFPRLVRLAATQHFRIHIRRARRNHRLFVVDTVCVVAGICCRDETPRRAGHYLQKTSCRGTRSVVRRRLSALRNSVQSAHRRTNRRHSGTNEHAARHCCSERHRTNATIFGASTQKYRIKTDKLT